MRDKCNQFLKVEHSEYPLSQKEDVIDGRKAEIYMKDEIKYYEIDFDEDDSLCQSGFTIYDSCSF